MKLPHWFKPEINVGHLLSIVSMITVLLGGWRAMEVRAYQSEAKIEAVRVQHDNDVRTLREALTMANVAQDKSIAELAEHMGKLTDTCNGMQQVQARVAAMLDMHLRETKP